MENSHGYNNLGDPPCIRGCLEGIDSCRLAHVFEVYGTAGPLWRRTRHRLLVGESPSREPSAASIRGGISPGEEGTAGRRDNRGTTTRNSVGVGSDFGG